MAEKTALVLSGIAPNSPLMAGALCAFAEHDVTFDIIFTSGAGVLLGLLYTAPYGKSPARALRDTVETGASDAITDQFPVGYKTYFKPGPFTRPYWKWSQLYKFPTPFPPSPSRNSKNRRFYRDWTDQLRLHNDLVDLWVNAITSSTLNYSSKGIAVPFPYLDELVDLDKLQRGFPGEFYINLFCLDDAQMQLFEKSRDAITLDHIRAAFCLLFIYPPWEIDGKFYIEGIERDPLNFTNFRQHVDKGDVKRIVYLDVLGSLEPGLAREPNNLLDAYAIAHTMPVLSLGKKDWARFKNVENKDERGNDIYELLEMTFDIPQHLWSRLLVWSRSNVTALWRIGYQTGLAFHEEYKSKLSHR